MRPIIIFAAALVALTFAAGIANGPVGDEIVVEGRVDHVCVSVSRQNNRVRCVAALKDGTSQTFDVFTPIATGSPVIFLKREGRFFGSTYELSSR
jgi:hypothetical protein